LAAAHRGMTCHTGMAWCKVHVIRRSDEKQGRTRNSEKTDVWEEASTETGAQKWN
jgi:hypothetical protein